MTVGNRTVDKRTGFASYWGITEYAGLYQTKQWNGQDYPHTKPSYTNVYLPGQSRPMRVYNKPPKRSTVVEHPYYCTFLTQRSEILNYDFNNPPGNIPAKTHVTIGSAFSVTVNRTWSASDDAKLLGKLRERIVGSDFNAGVAIAESSRSLGLITNSATRLYLALKALRRGRPGDAAIILTRNTAHEGKFKPPRATENNRSKWGGLWLELQYGWMPLLQDAEAGAKALAHAFSAPPQQVYRVARRIPLMATPSVGRVFSTREAYTTGYLKAIVREKNMPQLLGLTDPASIIWEMVPYSFVVDWFVPIGSYLSNLALARGIEATFVKTIYSRVNYIQTAMMSPSWPAYQYRSVGGSYNWGEVERTVSSSLQVPLPKWVGIDKALSVKRCLNAIALLSTLNANSR